MKKHILLLLTSLFAFAFLRDATAADTTKPNVHLDGFQIVVGVCDLRGSR